MPIRIDLHDNTSQVKIKPTGKGSVDVESSCDTDKKRFEALLDKEIQNRLLGDKELSDRIDDLSVNNTRYIYIDELSNGQINVSLLNDKEKIIDTKTITLTKKIIKSARLDEENNKLIYTCNDDSTIELDISALVDDIMSEITSVKQELSILSSDLDDTKLILSTVTNEDLTGRLDILSNETVPEIQEDVKDIQEELTLVDQKIDNINLELSEITNDEQTGRLDILDKAVAKAILDISELQDQVSDLDISKVDTILSNYVYTNPSNLTPDQIKELLVYVDNNGIPSYAKLSELGYTRVKDIEDIEKVDIGDLLLDMD